MSSGYNKRAETTDKYMTYTVQAHSVVIKMDLSSLRAFCNWFQARNQQPFLCLWVFSGMWRAGIVSLKSNLSSVLSLVSGMYTVCQLVSSQTHPLLLRELKHLFLQTLTFLVFLLVVFCSHMQPHLQVLHLSLQLCYNSWVCGSFLFSLGLVMKNITGQIRHILHTVMAHLKEPLWRRRDRKETLSNSAFMTVRNHIQCLTALL